MINKSGLITISFSNPMSVSEELKTLNQDGILVNSRIRSLAEEGESIPSRLERVPVDYLTIKVVPYEEENLQNLNMNWHVEKFESKLMTV